MHLTRGILPLLFVIVSLSSAELLAKAMSDERFNEQGRSLVYGKVFEHESKIFKGKRRYMVALPEQYQLNSFYYPTLFVIDADFQFHHVSNTVFHLARMGKIPPMIVVGIANQGQADYLKSNTWPVETSTEFGGVDIFKQYLYTELVPLIEGKYRIDERKALAGYSLGGLFVLQSYLDADSPFTAFLAMSPSIWYDEMSINQKFEDAIKQSKSTEKLNRPLFLSLANEKGMGVNELVAVLNKANTKFKQWQFKEYPGETHYTTALPALYDGLQFLAPNYFTDIGKLVEFEDYQQALAHFEQKKSLWSRFQFGWLQSYTFGKYIFYSEQQDKVDEILSEVKRRFASSYNEVLLNLALGFNRKKQFDKARRLLLSVEKQNKTQPKWHQQMSLALEGEGEIDSAKKYHQKALKLARTYQLESWEYWELTPDYFQQD